MMHSGSKRLIANNSDAFQVVLLKENRFYFEAPEMHKHNLSIPFENSRIREKYNKNKQKEKDKMKCIIAILKATSKRRWTYHFED